MTSLSWRDEQGGEGGDGKRRGKADSWLAGRRERDTAPPSQRVHFVQLSIDLSNCSTCTVAVLTLYLSRIMSRAS